MLVDLGEVLTKAAVAEPTPSWARPGGSLNC